MKISLLSFILLFVVNLYSQNDSLMLKHKNTIRWNLTPNFVVGAKSFVLGYERVVSKFQTVSINVGYLEKSPVTDMYGNVVFNFDESKRGGFDITADYRFYFKNRNKLNAPDGIYWGPYVSYNKIWVEGKSYIYENNVPVNSVTIKTDFSLASLGIEMGYQFVIKDRFTIDLIFVGPSFTNYNIGIEAYAETDIASDDEFYEYLTEFFKNNLPGGNILLSENKIEAKGHLNFNYIGFRYLVQLGWRF